MNHDKKLLVAGRNRRWRADGDGRIRNPVTWLAIVVALVWTFAQSAASPDASTAGEGAVASTGAAERPRIGLALSGGAARGLAHVGVLKVLDELRIPIDLVAGTSMGSIVGGLFALGHTPTEIEAAIRQIDWGDLFNDRPNRVQTSFRRKQDDRSDLLGFEFGIEGGRLKLPRSLVAGQKLAFAFESPALHTAGLNGFDALPIPFRAVSTDLRSGDMVVHERGSLVRALRASMSVPGFLAPVEVDDRLLVDGGIVRNLPIDVVRDMGAEIVIAVDVSEELTDRTREHLASLLGLSFQLTALVVKNNTDPVLPLADVVLRPDLGDLTMIDFERTDEAIRAGADATREAAQALSEYALSKDAYEAFLAQRPPVPNTAVVVDSIELDNRSRIDDRAIVQRMSVKTGETLEFEILRRDLVDIYDIGSLELVDFELREPRENSGRGVARSDDNTETPDANPAAAAAAKDSRTLRLLLNEKTYAPNLLRVGMWLNNDVRSRARFQAVIRLTRVAMNRLGAEWRTDFRLGSTSGVHTEWYQPLKHRRRWFVALDANYTNALQDLYTGDQRVAEYDITNVLGRLDVGMRIGRIGELRTGLFYGWAKTTLRTGAGFPVEEGGQGGWEARFLLDSLDDGDFPRRGERGDVVVELARPALGSATRHDRVQAGLNYFRTWGNNTVFTAADGGSSFGTQLPPHREFVRGGFGSLSGLHQEQLRGSVFATARLGYYRPIRSDVDIFGTDVYGAVWFETGNVWRDSRSMRLEDLLYTGAVALGAGTIFGPVYLGYGRTDRGDDSVFLTVGRQFGFQ